MDAAQIAQGFERLLGVDRGLAVVLSRRAGEEWAAGKCQGRTEGAGPCPVTPTTLALRRPSAWQSASAVLCPGHAAALSGEWRVLEDR